MEVTTGAGRRLVLRGPGRAGGEGTVFGIEHDPALVAKIYHQARATPEMHDKVHAMAASPPVDPALRAGTHRSIAWVIEPVYLDPARARFAGFTMPGIDRRSFIESHMLYDPGDRIARFGGSLTWRHLLTAAANLASSVAAVHAQGHRVGDLRETNVLISPTALVALIDCDSFQVRGNGRTFYPRVGSSEYLPPELHGVDFSIDRDRTQADAFALAVLIFRLLMNGVHPFQARGPRVAGATTIEAKIVRGDFPHVRRRGLAPPDFAPPFDTVPPALRALFVRCFKDGHRDPARRPNPQMWFDALKVEVARVRACRANPNHSFGSHLRACPWCAIARAAPDPFPAPGRVGVQAPVARAVIQRPAPVAPGAPATASPSPLQVARIRASTLIGAARIGLRLMRRVRRLRHPSRAAKRTALTSGVITTALVLLLSPVGRSVAAPTHATISWHASARGPCPSTSGAGVRSCRASWRFGPVKMSEQNSRNLFVLRQTHATLEVSFRVRFDGAHGCSVPWVDHLTFNRAGHTVCLGTCPERIEVRARGLLAPLVAASGIAAGSGPIACGRWSVGSWTFDVSSAGRNRMSLHYPGLAPQRLPALTSRGLAFEPLRDPNLDD